MRRILYFATAVTFLLVSCKGSTGTAQQNTIDGKLPRAEAGTGGFDAAGMQAFYDAVDATPGMDLDGIIVVRHGKVVAEKWWGEASAEKPHIMNSVSKSFTATGVGFAVSEGLFALDDKVVSFFQDKAPADNPMMLEMTVRDLLTMSTGQESEVSRGEDWITGFLNTPVDNTPGSTFRYSSMATFMLSAIIQKTSGQKLVDYLQPRLWGPLEIEGVKWNENPQGINVGGSGLYIKTEDMAKFGQLFLQKGVWNSKQLLSGGWVEEASSFKIKSAPSWDYSMIDPNSDWTHGYCYQMWRCRHNAYRADGAGGQYIIVIPDKDAVVAITASLQDMQAELNLVWDYILPALK